MSTAAGSLAQLQQQKGLFFFFLTELHNTINEGNVKTCYVFYAFPCGEIYQRVPGGCGNTLPRGFSTSVPVKSRCFKDTMRNLELQLKSKTDNFGFLCLALDESRDDRDRALLQIFITKD